MFPSQVKQFLDRARIFFRLKVSPIRRDFFYFSLLLLCVALPFQFALNPFPGFDLALTRVFIVLIFAAWLIVSLKNKVSIFKKDKLTYLLIAFLLLAAFSLIFSSNLFWSLRKLVFLFSIIPLYFFAASVLNTDSKKRRTVIALVLGATLLATLSLLQFAAQFIFGIESVYAFLAHNTAPFFLGKSFSQAVLAYPSWLVNVGGTTYLRAIGTFPDPHMLSYYLGMLTPLALALWATSKKYAWWWFFAVLLLAIANVYTFTRSGYVALIAGALIVLPLVSRSGMKKIFLAIIVLIFLFLITPGAPVAERFTSSFDVKEGSNQGRISNWKQALPIIISHPMGVGIGMYPLAVDPSADYRKPIYAHNLYLDIAAEMGLPAMFLFVAIVFFAFLSFWKTAKKEPLYLAGVSSLTIFAVQSLVETPLYSVHILTLLMLLLALSPQEKFYGKNNLSE